jgi:hypothetical protein
MKIGYAPHTSPNARKGRSGTPQETDLKDVRNVLLTSNAMVTICTSLANIH